MQEPQIIGLPTSDISTFENEEGKFFRSFLISTKDNDANWKIERKTGHDKVKSAIQRDFAIIPELIKLPISQGGGGHYKGTREQILKAYADNSHGKIVKLVGPFYYSDSPEDYWYDQITKLSNSRSASVLHSEGQKTWNGYDVSPHIFVNKGKNEVWEDWEFAGLNLVIKGAFGNQAIITKFCDGTEAKCFKDLVASSTNTNDETIAELITSFISKTASTSHTMSNNEQVTKIESGLPDSSLKDKSNSNTPTTSTNINSTVDPQKGLSEAPKVEETMTVSKAAWEAMKKSVTDSDNERKEEILTSLFSVFEDEKEREKAMQPYEKLSLDTAKMLKVYTERMTPKIEERLRATLKAEAKEAEKDDNSKSKDKKADDKKDKDKERSASSSLDKEPRIKFHSPNSDDNNNNDDSREASVPEVRNEVWALRQKMMRGREVN